MRACGFDPARIKEAARNDIVGYLELHIEQGPILEDADLSVAIAHAEALGRPAVVTVGHCLIDPNAPVIIPRSLTFPIDARHPDPVAAKALHERHNVIMDEIAEKRGIAPTRRLTLDHPPCQCAPVSLEAMQSAADGAGIAVLRMPRGAGHDAQQMSRICPVAMLFVRSKDGRSHTTEEISRISDIVDGIQVLTGTLHRLAYA